MLTHDYNVLSIDIRGTGSTGGDWTCFGLNEHYDVKYLIDEWIPEQPWSDGTVGMIGPSYIGIMQYLVAGLIDRDENGEPEHLKALFSLATLSDTYKDILMHGGNVDLEFVPFWLVLVEAFGSIPPLLYLGEGGFPDFQTIKEATGIWKNHFKTIYVQWVIELNDVFPDGRARNISSGWLSAWHRPYDPNEPDWVEEHYVDPGYVPFDPFYSRPDKHPKPISENDLYQYVVEIWPTCNIFKAGHRIRISISTSDFPHLLTVLIPSNNTIVIDEDHIAKLEFTTTNDSDEGETWKWVGDIDHYLLNHKN